ncbi:MULTISPECIES: asparagine synthase-related protein [Spirulina sp. CCY15215]|uniref:asparagine synthetase B family protein n=1 Tax=Spirulina sp. CCY15215 TaxID=2767591 RepID=UPI001950C3BC|nr:asparagine synthase-related protein [Spirulina major]
MSGICGIFQRDRQPVHRQLLQTLTNSIADRGPDGQNIWCENHIGLGHTLLITTDESITERQPLTLDGKTLITADLRLDGRKELIAKLGDRATAIAPHSPDVLLLLHAYQIWGEDCLEHLLGVFAFAIWDDRAQKLFCARDRLGVKPFFYANLGDVFLFSNTLNCLHLHPAVSQHLNEEAIADFLLFGFNHNPQTTTFKDIQRLPGGHSLTVTGDRLSLRRYWTLPVPEMIRYRQPETYIEQFQTLLDEAIGDRLRTEKVGIFFSGGLDSTNMAATALDVAKSNNFNLDLQGFTVIYRDRIPDREEKYAQLAADALEMPLHFLVADDYQLFQGQELPHLKTPEPCLNPFPLQDEHQYRQIAQHSRIGLYGEGADEALRASKVMDLWGKMPAIALLGDLVNCLKRGLQPQWGTGILGKVRHWKKENNEDDGYLDWFDRDFERRLQLRDRLRSTKTPVKSPHPFRPQAYQDLLQPMWMLNFEASDPGFTRIPLEVRFPFLDLRLLNYLLSLPPFPWFINKELERATLSWRRGQGDRQDLPAAIAQRPKTPLAGQPFYTFLQAGQRPWDELKAIDAINAYVDVEKLLQVTRREKLDIYTAWCSLRPLGLGHWLQQF